ncbi:MAG TPA: YraN family protein [Mycobacteriales bacterium]|jgi:putative endonuclease|nr:YraN family protein [Mycobacteriales bacterium]
MATAAADALGRHGEELAAQFVAAKGYRIVARNWRSPDRRVRGELDLVLRDGPTLVFCEVKTRTSGAYGLPAEAVSEAKRRKLRRLAALWLTLYRGPWTEVRFDVIAVLQPRHGVASLEHLKGVL